jgi:hypothetical protein
MEYLLGASTGALCSLLDEVILQEIDAQVKSNEPIPGKSFRVRKRLDTPARFLAVRKEDAERRGRFVKRF